MKQITLETRFIKTYTFGKGLGFKVDATIHFRGVMDTNMLDVLCFVKNFDEIDETYDLFKL
jgi:hypothetical protein